MNFKMGIFGFGGIAKFHCKLINTKIPQITVKGAYDINPEKNADIEEYGLHIYPDAESLLADPEIDLILIATPNNFHKDYAIRAMRAGKHVLCEKPMAKTAAEAEEFLGSYESRLNDAGFDRTSPAVAGTNRQIAIYNEERDMVVGVDFTEQNGGALVNLEFKAR